jgi:acetyl esterase
MPNTSRSPAPRVADLVLRGSGGQWHARVHWPVLGAAKSSSSLLVFFIAHEATRQADELCDLLRARPDLVVLATRCLDVEAAIATVEWAAEHAAELGADAETIVVAGDGDGARLADAVALHVAVTGWPALSRRVLIDPVGGLAGLDALDALVLRRFKPSTEPPDLARRICKLLGRPRDP